jgi:DNA-directed RNA polymerase specialized sigma24 family protein
MSELTGHELMALARSSVLAFELQRADRDDAIQEAAVGIHRKLDNLSEEASPAECRGYLRRVGRSRALDYLKWRSRTFARECYGLRSADRREEPICFVDEAGLAEERRYTHCVSPTPEDEVANVGLAAAIGCVADVAAFGNDADAVRVVAALEAGYARLSSQEAALFRYKLGVEEMRPDLVRLGTMPRGSVSNRARRKFLSAAEEGGVSHFVTPELLLRVFGAKGN